MSDLGTSVIADKDIDAYNRAVLAAYREVTRNEAFEEAARLHEQINPASDDERLKGHPGAGAMGAVIEYRDALRGLKTAGGPR